MEDRKFEMLIEQLNQLNLRADEVVHSLRSLDVSAANSAQALTFIDTAIQSLGNTIREVGGHARELPDQEIEVRLLAAALTGILAGPLALELAEDDDRLTEKACRLARMTLQKTGGYREPYEGFALLRTDYYS